VVGSSSRRERTPGSRGPGAAGIALLIAAVFAGAFSHFAAANPAPVTIVDASGHELRLANPPARVITQIPALTEMVCALGECTRLVATDRYSNSPASVRGLPKTGGLDDAAIELIVSLKPDLVMLANASRVSERLRALGVATLELDVRTFSDIATSIDTLGRVFRVPGRAAALNAQITHEIDDVVASFAERMHGRRPSVYYEVDAGPYAAGPGSYIGELLARLGTRNIVDAGLGPFPKLNPEYVVPRNPDVILIGAENAAELARRPGWGAIRAVREGRVCSFPLTVADTIVRPGPRVAEGLRAVADCIGRVAP
jgi:iron complex transport system substrate-binding protein